MKVYISESLYNIKSEELLSFLKKNHIDPEELNYLGSGDFGEAYSTGDGRVLKKTRSDSEYKIALEILNKPSPIFDAFAKIYDVAKIEGYGYILMEELETDSEIEDLYNELTSTLDEQGLPIQWVSHLDTDEVEISSELEAFIDGISDINRAYNYLGIEASDIKPDNLGYDDSGNLKAFDIDNKQR